jgi:hypothetical protein
LPGRLGRVLWGELGGEDKPPSLFNPVQLLVWFSELALGVKGARNLILHIPLMEHCPCSFLGKPPAKVKAGADEDAKHTLRVWLRRILQRSKADDHGPVGTAEIKDQPSPLESSDTSRSKGGRHQPHSARVDRNLFGEVAVGQHDGELEEEILDSLGRYRYSLLP